MPKTNGAAASGNGPHIPQNIEAERIVLGAILTGAGEWEAVLDRLEPTDFFDTRHQVIFRALKGRYERSEPIDHVLVSDSLKADAQLEQCGGIAYLASLGDQMPRKLNIEPHGEAILASAKRRELIRTMERIQQMALSGQESALFVLDHAQECISAIRRRDEADDESVTYREAGMKYLETIGLAPGPRIFTGVWGVDEKTGGFRGGELIIITAETGTGKTVFAQQTRRVSCCRGQHTLFASGEMKAAHLIARELAAEARIEQWKTRRPEKLGPHELEALVTQIERECKICRILDGELTLARIRRTARAMARQGNLSMVVIDYDELVDVPGKDEWEQQRVLARAAKSLGMELNCPVLLISQLRKVLTGEDRQKPTLQRLYGSGAKAKHSSIVIYVDRRYVQDLEGEETEANIYILKSRDGQVGRIPARFNVRTLRFEDADEPKE